MCILLYVKLLWCSGTTQIYGQLEKGGLGICAFFYMLNLISVVVLHSSMVDWRREALEYEHSSICETYLVQ